MILFFNNKTNLHKATKKKKKPFIDGMEKKKKKLVSFRAILEVSSLG